MPDRRVDVLLVGGGVASAEAARTLVEEGFDGSLLLVGRELDPPYERPPLTKEYLRGECGREAAHVPAAGWFERAPVELLTRTSVTKLDTDAREATLSTKETVGYGSALLATGAMVRRLQVPGTELEGLHYIRAFGNSDALRGDLEDAEHVVCVGGSYIGCEVAASLTAIGKSVTIVMMEDEPMERGFGAHVGRFVRGVLGERGIAIVPGDEVERFAGEERIERVVTKGGREIPAQVVVAGVGVTPDVMLARSAGLDLGETGGIRCEETLRTSAAHVWAAGDVCEYRSVIHGGRRIRVEHTEHARAQGAHVARAIMGSDQPFAEVPYFFTDLADWLSLESVGPAVAWDEEVVTGDMAGGAFGVWYLEGGELRGAVSAGGHLDLDRARELIRSREPLTADELR